jgi:hypothetical protein
MIRPLPGVTLREALREIVEGKNVKRGKHDLRWDSHDLVPLFREVLRECGYTPITVNEAPVQPGERVPAFHILGHIAYFGWIFWEKFTDRKLRKLFGSDVRNAKGDWAIQIPASRDITIYANPTLRCEMDLDQPTSL